MSRKRLLLCLCLLLARAAASQAQPDIALSDTTHNYGDVAVGDTASWAFKIYNVGTDTLVVDSTTFTPSPFEVGAPTFPETVAVNDSIEVTVWFIPSAMDSVSDTLNIHSNDPTDSVVYVYLSGRGLAPDIALSDTSHNFATILVGDSADWVLTIFNLGTDTLTVDSVLVDPSQFEVSTPTFPDTIPPADSVQVTVWFLPSDTGAVAGSLLVFSNDPDEETLAVALSGTGVLQDIALSDTSHDFGDVLVGDSLDWVLTIYNEGTAELTVDSIPSAPTEFEVTAPPLPDTLAPADSILVTVTFVPSDTGAVAGSLLVFSNDPDEGTLSVSLSGNGVVPDIALSDTSHDYGDVLVGDSADWVLWIYNVGTGTLTVDSTLLVPPEFEIVCTSFPRTVPPSDSIGVTLRFTPTNWGAVAGSLMIFSNDPDEETLSVALTGNGLAPDIELPVTSHDFGDVVVGDSADWIMEIYNLGNADLIVDSILADPSEFAVVSPSFPDTVAPLGTLEVTVTFAPSDTGAVAGSLTVFSNDPDEETLAVALAGNGLAPDIALSETSHDFGDVLVGDSSDWVLQIYNLGTADLIIDSILAAPAEFEFSPTAFPDTIAPTESLTVTVTFSPADTGTVSGNLVLYCSDPDEGVVFVLLTGRGVVPDIAIDPDSLEITVWEGGTISTPLSVINEGTARLIFEMSSDSLWLSQNPDSGGVDPQETLIVEVIFDATSLTIGDYYDTIRVVSNDPDEPELTVPVHLTVREAQVVVSIPDAWSLPGATVEMTMDIDNQTERDDPVAAFQAHLTFVDTLLTVLNVVPTPRIDGLFDWSNPDPGRLIIVFATSELEAIESGTGPVAQITFEVSASATVGDSTPIGFENVILSDTLGYPIPMRTEDGTLFLGTGLKGDVNLDGEVNILDAVWIINYILEQIEFTPFQFWAADCNEDGEVNILDVVGIINVILEIGTCPPTPGTAKAAVATARVWSPAESIGPRAKSIELPIFVDSAIDIAGMQLKLSYNPTAQTLGTPQLSGRSAHMTLASNATSGELTILVYSPEGEAIPAGTGPVLTIPLQTHDTRRKTQDATLEFSEVVLAGEGCQEIPLEIRPISLKSRRLPETWSLEQNYPNPFNPVTTIRYALAVTGERGLVSSPVHTTLKIYNILGQEIRTLVDEPKEPGYYTVTWDGKDSFGNDVTSGIYFYRLTAGSYNDTKRMVLLK